MMGKDIDPPRIVDATLGLMALEGPGTVSFRSVARSLGCAHSNLYNHFPDLDSLLWACGDEILARMTESVSAPEGGADSRRRLTSFFGKVLSFYLDHPGWFQLLWSHPFRTPRPRSNREAADRSIGGGVDLFARELEHRVDARSAHEILHVVHAYLHGELSIFFAGRSLFGTRAELEASVVSRCADLSILMDRI